VAPLVSIVVPVFNGERYLPALIQSLLNQDYPELEIIFSEGGSTDSSPQLLNSLDDPRVRVIRQPSPASAAGNWTAATQAATGEFTKLVCQDDLIHSDTITRQMADLAEFPSAVMAVGQRDIIDAHGKVIYAPRGLAGVRARVLSGQDALHACYRAGTNVIGEPLAVLFRTDVLQSVMPWEDSNPLMLDLSTYTKVAPMGDVVLRHESVGAFRVSDQSWSTRLARQQLKQTRAWQEVYSESFDSDLTQSDRMRGWLGRHTQVNLRRAAYAALKLRGRLTN
jgi:glycosyltransferase involved in cell wall biosynthesis